MLTFILGRAASGKTHYLLGQLKECVNNGLSPVLIVPEQFSFESEKAILDRLGDRDAQRVTVVSFTRLCDEIERQMGGISARVMTDSDRMIMMTRALRSVSDSLSMWKRYVRSSSFATSILDTITEFKVSAVTPDDITEVAEKLPDTRLADKLKETALLFREYDRLVSERFTDPSDRLTKLYDKLGEFKFFENKTVFIDSFKGFTGQQLRILDRILQQAQNVVITLPLDIEDKRKTGLFSNIAKTRTRIINMAKSHGVKIAEDIVLKDNYYNSPDIAAVEELMARGRTNYAGDCNNVTFCAASSIYDEAEFVARNIRRIVRERGARFDDFVVIARDTEDYEQALSAACRKNGVALFTDRRMPLSALPVAVCVTSAVAAARSLSTENILRFHKSGIGILSSDEISLMENYTYLWNITGAQFEDEWTMNPKGFVSGEDEEIEPQLTVLNSIRKRAIEPIINFKNKFNTNAAQMSRAIVDLLGNCNAADSFAAIEEEYRKKGDLVFADALRQSWDTLMSLLDSLAICFGNDRISAAEFSDALGIAINTATVGVIPQMLYEVTFGSADRIRPSKPKYAFILGANQGKFPRTVPQNGIFAGNERARLIDMGIDIPDKSIGSAIDEDFLVYSNVCCPTERLFISYLSGGGNDKCEPSVFVTNIKTVLSPATVCEPSQFEESTLPETDEAAFSELCKRISTDSRAAATIRKSIADNKAIQIRIDALEKTIKPQRQAITPDTARMLYGNNIYMSPSKFDNFSRCRFMHFCRDGLKASRLQPAEFDVLQRGTMVHFVLEQVVKTYGKGISEFDEAKISEVVERFVNEYLDSVVGYRSIETPRLKFLVSTITRTLKYIVARLAEEFAQSDFTPAGCELRIGDGEDADIPTLDIPLNGGGRLVLNGIIDRLDNWNGFVRIVDYKTGSRKFKLPDILMGQNMQMLIYLYAAVKSGKYGDKAAGIFYMPSSRDRENDAAKRRMSGMMLADSELVKAMDKTGGEFVPKLGKTPNDSFVFEGDFEKIFSLIENKLSLAGEKIMNGDIAVDPVDGLDSPACKYCDFAAVCGIGDTKHKKVEKMKNAQVLEEIERQVH